MEEEKRLFSKNFEIAFIVTLAIVGVLIATAIWTTGRNISKGNNSGDLSSQIIENQKELQSENTALHNDITSLQNQTNDKFASVYANQQKISDKIDASRQELGVKIDRANQKTQRGFEQQ